MDASQLLGDVKLLPVVVIDNADHAVPLAECLLRAGIHAIEVTLRTHCAAEAIARISGAMPEMLVGAGSVRTLAHFKEVADLGAHFAVSPGATPKLLQEAPLPYVPGTATASEVLQAYEYGYTLVKFFPAERLGGLPTLQAISQPLPEMKFCPTGGIDQTLAARYLAQDYVACVGGSWFVPGDAINRGDFDAIEHMCREAVAALATD